jgi:hypothetical protein
MSAGYSGRPLAEKLGIKDGYSLAFLNAPAGYSNLLGGLPDGAMIAAGRSSDLDFVQLFVTESASLERVLPGLKRRVKRGGMIWVSWPKASSKVQTDLSDAVVREVGLKNGLVDVKVCAVDETWSALKFVRRLEDRHGNSRLKKEKS